MAGELQYRHSATGATLYALLRNESGQVWNGSAFETQVNANWTTYAITLTETPASGYFYIGNMPAATAGVYHGEVYLRAGGTPAITDGRESYFDEFHWNGTAVVQPLPNVASGAAGGVRDVAMVGGTTQTAGDLYTAITAIGIVGVQVAATISSVTRTVGDNDGGLAAAVNAHDESYFDTGEIAGSGLTVDVVVNTSTTTQIPSTIRVTGYYNGSASHSISVQAYNYTTSGFDTIGVMLNRNTPFDYDFPLSADHHKTSDASGKMEIRFIHSTATYNNSHVLRLDFIQIIKQTTDSETASSIAAIKTQTDRMQFTNANNIMADVDTVKTRAVTDVGSGNTVYLGTAAYSTLTEQNVRDAGKLAPTAGDPAAGSIDKHLDDILEDTGTTLPAAIAGTGSGARTVTITVNDGTNPLQNATVRMTQGAESYVGSTNASGIVTFYLDDATWTVTITKPLYTFTATTLVVNGNKTQTYSMTAISVTPSDSGQVTGVLTCFDEGGKAEANVTITLKQTAVAEATGDAYDAAERTETSNAKGLVQFTGLFAGATYKWRRGISERWYTVTIAANAVGSVSLTSGLGVDE
jgi:hypothetical protein